ncbi:putative ribonuclease H-like domain-containing protein [Tanacetum coccineum]
MRPFGCLVTILNTLDHLGKFDGKADEGFFVGYSTNSKAFRVFNSRTRIVEENLHVKFSEETPNIAGNIPNWLFDIDALTISMNYKPVVAENQTNGNACTKENINVGQAGKKIGRRKDVFDTLENEISGGDRIQMSQENNAIDENIVYGCIDDPNMPNLEDIIYSDDDEEVSAEAVTKNLATTVPVYINKKDDRGIVVRNKARLVAQGYTQEEGSEDLQFPNKVYKVEKALYGLHQAPKAWYETLSTYLLENGFRRGTMDKTLFINKDKDGAQEIPDEFYGGAHFLLRVAALLKDEVDADVDVHLYRSMIRSLMYLTASKPDIMFVVCACARFQVTPKTSHLHDVKRIFRYLKGHPKLGLWYPRDSPFDLEAFSDSDYVGASLDSKSKIGGVNFFRRRYDIEIRHHFIRDSYEKKLIQVIKIHTDHNVPDLLTTEFDVSRFQYLIANETVIKEWEDRMERAATTASSLEAEQNIVYAARHSSLLCVRHKVNAARHIAMLMSEKVIITKKSVRSDLMLEDAEGTECLLNDVIFEQLTLMGAKTTVWNEFSSTMASAIILFLDKQVEGMSKHKGIYVTPSHTKKIFVNMKREGKGFSGRITPLFQTMMVFFYVQNTWVKIQLLLLIPIPHPCYQSSYLSLKRNMSKRNRGKDIGPTEPNPDEATTEEPISTPSCNPPQSGEDRLHLTELMSLCTKLQKQVLDLEEAKTAQAKEIASLKKRVKQLEKRKKSRTSGLKRLRKVGSASRVESSNDVSLGAQEDASKQERKIADLDANAKVTLIDETQERYNDETLFDVDPF